RVSARCARSRPHRQRGARRTTDPRRASAEVGHDDGVRRARQRRAADVRRSKRGRDRSDRSRNAVALGRVRALHVRETEGHAARDADHGTGILVRVVRVPPGDDNLFAAAESLTAISFPATRDSLMSLTPGTRLGAYEILSPLGEGGMGEVYRAHDAKLNRGVAIKILLAAVATDPDRLARFSREAQVLA